MGIEPPLTRADTLAEAYALLAEAGDAAWRPIAGGTDLLVQIAGEIGEPPARVLDISRLDPLRGISREGDHVVLGALTTYTEIRRSAVLATAIPALGQAAATIGAVQIQNRGTIGGNVVNASPAGDMLPILLATGADLVLGSSSGERVVRADDFWTGYRSTALRADELLVRVRIPVAPGRELRFRKIGTRRAQAVSKVVVALAWSGDDGGPWTDVRLALGSVAATTIRARMAEAAIAGRRPDRPTAERAAAALARELQPIDDVRSTADYRRAVAARVVHRMIRDEGGW